ncbi:MAG: hypothetical protein MZV65_15045 [Chromatiales bacterium]|nr:hypothetical protein [Chromatiales bacterium]
MSPILSVAGLLLEQPQFCIEPRNEPFDKGELAEQMVRDTLPVIATRAGGEFRYAVKNVHRSIGARLSGEIARRHGDLGMECAPINIAPDRHRRPELRGVEHRRPASIPGRRCQRLCRQGYGRRQAGNLPTA